MKRSIKNTIVISAAVLLTATSFLTIYAAKNSKSNNNHRASFGTSQSMQMPNQGSTQDGDGNAQQMPQMPNQGSTQDGNGNAQQMPQMPNQGSTQGGNGNTQQMPNQGSTQGGNGNTQQMPQMPNQGSTQGGNGNTQQMPQMPNQDGGSFMQGPPSMDRTQFDGNNAGSQSLGTVKNGSISWIFYVLFALESVLIAALAVYMIMTKCSKLTIKEAFASTEKIIIAVLTAVIIAGSLTFGQAMIAKAVLPSNSIGSSFSTEQHSSGNSQVSVDANGAVTVTDTQTLSDTYTTSNADESVIVVKDGGALTIDGATLNKTGGDCTNTENSEFYGVNAGLLVQENSTATVKNAKITTSAKGSNAVFSTGENSKIYISDSEIVTTGEGSARGLDATYGGYIEADNVTITTAGNSCATLATDRGEGTVKVKNSNLTTNGQGSPVIYSTGDISIDNTKGVANGSQIAVIEGKNSATVTASTVTASGKGNRNDVDNCGVMLYQSMSGDANEGTAVFTATDSTLAINSSSNYYKTAPMFFVTNTDAVINLKNTKLVFGSGTLLDVKATSEWGNSGSNGGNITLNAENQTLAGDIKADSISTVSVSLKSSAYSGTINGDNTAKNVSLTLDKSSTLTLTGDCYVTSLTNADSTNSNINFNGYKLYVNSKAVN